MFGKNFTCPACGESMEHWNQGIYECQSCGNMADEEFLEEMGVRED